MQLQAHCTAHPGEVCDCSDIPRVNPCGPSMAEGAFCLFRSRRYHGSNRCLGGIKELQMQAGAVSALPSRTGSFQQFLFRYEGRIPTHDSHGKRCHQMAHVERTNVLHQLRGRASMLRGGLECRGANSLCASGRSSMTTWNTTTERHLVMLSLLHCHSSLRSE